ncbi:MAG: DEAD/DEAH box helicase [Thermodesulfobacteriota bacterium]
MSFNPILALNQVIDEYRDYLRTEFRAKDPQLKEALERELDQSRFLAQEPFFQAHRPFRAGKRWRDLPLDARLARVMEERSRGEFSYLHQSEAIGELLSPQARSVVVTTGTGSGKTEAFLLPVIQNAAEDATRHKKTGLTAILVYPMNALANDQEQRIKEYLGKSGFTFVRVEKYDRGTPQAKREELRQNPPHILLTNYMMLEYLLVRPADREGIFANHRCRFLVLDEVHTYRGTLGANIALLVRRLQAHLARARQDWHPTVLEAERARRYPSLVMVGTSATIRSVAEEGVSREEAKKLRDREVQEFFAKLTGAEPAAIRVLGEELEDLHAPSEAAYPGTPAEITLEDISRPNGVHLALCKLAGVSADTPIPEAARRCRLLWDLNRWIVGSPLSVSQIVSRVREEVPERKEVSEETVRHEVEAALLVGAAIPDELPGSLRLRVHRFIRGGWRFHRCVNPDCGRLYPMGEEQCSCGFATAPLYLCRNCGADFLRFVAENPLEEPLRPSAVAAEGPEWVLYEPGRFETVLEDEVEEEEGEESPSGTPPRRRGGRQLPTQMKKRPVLHGSFDPRMLTFSDDAEDYPVKVILAPARTRCLCCGGLGGSRNVITPVSLGTSAAVKVLAEGLLEALEEVKSQAGGQDDKERLLIFSDSRQDAAHQARFIIFASRYDRMRRRLVRLLREGGPLPIQRAVELLGDLGIRERDNPYAPEDEQSWLTDEALQRIRSWEEAPLLDDLSVTAGYRGTLLNLGLVGVRYHRLDEYVKSRGQGLAQELGVSPEALEHICRCLLDEMRTRGALSREMLRYHPRNTACPAHILTAQWERRVKRPQGYASDIHGKPLASITMAEIPPGINAMNAWRKPGAGGRGPSLERILTHLLKRFGGVEPNEETILSVLKFLSGENSFIKSVDLFGLRERRKLLQVNAETVRLVLLSEEERARCSVCGAPRPWALHRAPCPLCHGGIGSWPDAEMMQNRTIRRILAPYAVTLEAGEHTAQVTHDERVKLEDYFKAPGSKSKVNVLSCSPTLEMGIDVGGLDAVMMRNIPPRPDNYAQRGGRAGRRDRVGMVLGYVRSTPHDQYFYDSPGEMISGEVPTPVLALGNRDVILRHINAIVFGISEPGLAGRMVEYVTPRGEVRQEAVDALIDGLKAQFGEGLSLAKSCFGAPILSEANLNDEMLDENIGSIPERVADVINRTARQVIELRQALDVYAEELRRPQAATRAGELVARLLGIPQQRQGGSEADDRSAGYPLRRFAEFGILPGYEFPTEPASLRLLGDPNEEDPVNVSRRFGIGQFQPDAQVYARTKRWRVMGLDTASPWNPRSDGPSWYYEVCRKCGLRFKADHPRCPRCSDETPGPNLPAFEFGGFIGRRDEGPVLDEEERFIMRNLVRSYPQWDGEVIGRWGLAGSWSLRLNRGEEIQWLNEGLPPTAKDFKDGVPQVPLLHNEAKGYLLCGACGRMLSMPEAAQSPARGRRGPRASGTNADPFGHKDNCPHAGVHPRPLGIATVSQSEVLRLIAPLPPSVTEYDIKSTGLSLGYALRIGMRHLYMLDGSEIEFELEGPWTNSEGEEKLARLAMSFIDPSLGGTGYLKRIAEDLHLVAKRALEHLQHSGCETACYRCLKSYANQRFHEYLIWPLALPYLEAMAQSQPIAKPLEIGDIDDPRPWLEAYKAGVGSPLELKFLKLFEENGFRLQKQVPISPMEGEQPISIADFAVPEKRLAIYVDSAAFHLGGNLRRDKYIRDKLRNGNPPWRIVELRAQDLAHVTEIFNIVRQQLDS